MEVLLEDDQAKKLLELLQEAIAEYDIPTEMEWDTGWQGGRGGNWAFYLHLDVSGFFRLTEDSPWYALAENHVGEIVRQSFEYAGSTASLYISPEMTQVIDYLRELGKRIITGAFSERGKRNENQIAGSFGSAAAAHRLRGAPFGPGRRRPGPLPGIRVLPFRFSRGTGSDLPVFRGK